MFYNLGFALGIFEEKPRKKEASISFDFISEDYFFRKIMFFSNPVNSKLFKDGRKNRSGKLKKKV